MQREAEFVTKFQIKFQEVSMFTTTINRLEAHNLKSKKKDSLVIYENLKICKQIPKDIY